MHEEVKKVTDAMEDLGFVTGFKVGDGVGLTQLTCECMPKKYLDSIGFPRIIKFIVTKVSDKEITIYGGEKDITMGFHPESVHENIFLIYRMGTSIPNAELFNRDNQNITCTH